MTKNIAQQAPGNMPTTAAALKPELGVNYSGHVYDPCVHAVETIYTVNDEFLGTIEHRHHENAHIRIHARARDGITKYCDTNEEALSFLINYRPDDRPRVIVRYEIPLSISSATQAAKMSSVLADYLNRDRDDRY